MHRADLVDGVAALVFVFDVGGIGQPLSLQQLQHLDDRRVARAERRRSALIALAILEVQRDDAIVMLLQERDGVLIRRR